MPKKVDIDGETFIVSEDVNFDSLDTDNMIEKEEFSELGKIAQDVSKKVLGKMSLGTPNKEKGTIQTQPILEFHLRFAKQRYVFKGKICWAEGCETSSSYKLEMSNDDALSLHSLVLKAQGKIGIYSKRILFLKSITHYDENTIIEFLPPKGKKGVTAQKMERVKVTPKSTGKTYVEIDFASIHWR